MSIAPANRASIAEGPALKLVHWIFTFGPIALSNQPLALPIIGCACVMLGNAPTRITVCAETEPQNPTTMTNNHKAQVPIPPLRLRSRLAPLGLGKTVRNDNAELRIIAPCASMDHHRQDAGLSRFLLAPAAGRLRTRTSRNVCQRSMLENLGGGITNLEKHAIKRPMLDITIDEAAQLFSVAEGRQR